MIVLPNGAVSAMDSGGILSRKKEKRMSNNPAIEYAFDKLECKRISVEGAKEKETRMVLTISKGIDDEIKGRFHFDNRRDPLVDYNKGVQLDVEEIGCGGDLEITIMGSHGTIFFTGHGEMDSARITGETIELKIAIPHPGFTWEQFGELWEHIPNPILVSMVSIQTKMFDGEEDALES